MPRCAPAFVAAALFFAAVGSAQDRFALVIGNSAYEQRPLKNPVHDADSMAAALKELNFKVVKHADLDKEGLGIALERFESSLTKNSVALFFYAGHGVQLNDTNYLVPLGADITQEIQVKHRCVEVGRVLKSLDESQAALKVLVLDCCRDNPFILDARSVRGGLAPVTKISEGTIIAFSTAPGRTAADGRGKNSPYTKHLVTALSARPNEGLEVVEAFRTASRAVRDECDQRPWLNLDASADAFYLWRKSAPNAGGNPPPLPESFANKLGVRFKLIPAGEFLMGSPVDEIGRRGDEAQVRVSISRRFYLSETEITQAQWNAVMGTEPWKGKASVAAGSSFPATHVDWREAEEFCRKLSSDGERYRLPTEAEWEYAARGGKSTAFSFGADASPLPEFAWFLNNTENASSHEVGGKKPNPFGLRDMHGNVAEWCRDVYEPKLIPGDDPELRPTAEDPEMVRVNRGGGFKSPTDKCRSAARAANTPGYRAADLGFRIVLETKN